MDNLSQCCPIGAVEGDEVVVGGLRRSVLWLDNHGLKLPLSELGRLAEMGIGEWKRFS